MNTMPAFEMEFYNAHSGVVFTLKWRNKREFLLGKAFLTSLLGEPAGNADMHSEETDFYYLKTEQQRDALFDFKRNLERAP